MMLDSWIIEELKRRERRESEQEEGLRRDAEGLVEAVEDRLAREDDVAAKGNQNGRPVPPVDEVVHVEEIVAAEESPEDRPVHDGGESDGNRRQGEIRPQLREAVALRAGAEDPSKERNGANSVLFSDHGYEGY